MSFRDGFSGGMAGFNYMQDQQNMRRDQRRQDEGDQMRRTDYADKQSRQAQDDNMAKVGRISAMIVAAPTPEARASIYASAKGHLGGFAQEHGLNLPDTWDESLLDEVRSMSQMLGQGGSGQPPGLREFQGMTQGFSPEEVAQAQRVKAGITAAAGTQSNAPFTALKYTDGQGRNVVESFDKRSGAASAPGASAGGPKMPPMALASIFQKFGGQLTSAFRSPEKNRQVGGVANSQHMQGTGQDWVFPPQVKAQAMAFAQAQGYEAIDEGDHLHFELPGAGANPYASRPAEDQAALTTGAQEGAKFDVDQQRAGFDVSQAAAKVGAEANARAGSERDATQAQRTVDASRAIGLLDEADDLIGRSTGSGIGRVRDAGAAFFGKSTEGAQAIASLQAISGQLISMMPRMQGPQSDKDVLLYKQMAGDLANPETPTSTRKAAALTIRKLQMKYAGKQATAAPGNNIDSLLEKYK